MEKCDIFIFVDLIYIHYVKDNETIKAEVHRISEKSDFHHYDS